MMGVLIFNKYRGDEALSQEKEAKQRTQKDDERRASAKMPDACLAFNKYNMSFLLLEVSGPPNKENHQHFVGDRVKIARQLKEILKSIRLTIANGDDDKSRFTEYKYTVSVSRLSQDKLD